MSKITQVAATTQAARVDAIVASYVTGQRNTTEAGRKALADFASTLSGVPAISDETWKANYQEGVLKNLIASGVVSETSAPMTASKVKTAAQGVTHGIALGDMTFSAYVVHCRSDESRAIMGKAPKADTTSTVGAGAQSNAKAPSATADPSQYMADGFDDDAKGRKAAKSLAESLGGAEMAMGLMIVCDGDVALAKLVRTIITSREAEFTQWASTIIAAPTVASAKRSFKV